MQYSTYRCLSVYSLIWSLIVHEKALVIRSPFIYFMKKILFSCVGTLYVAIARLHTKNTLI